MQGNHPPSRVPKSSSANAPAIISRQQPRHPGIILAPPVERRVEQQEVERIRGGCCLCPGGYIWVCSPSCSAAGDYEEKAQAQRLQQRAESEASRSKPPPNVHPALQTRPHSPRTAFFESSGFSSPPSRPQSRRPTADDPEQESNQPNPTSRPGRVSFSPSPPHMPSQPQPQWRSRPTEAPSTHSGVSEPTAVEPSISGQTEVDSQSAMPPKAPRELWQRLRDRIFNRPRRPSEESGQQQNTPETRRHSINFGRYELTTDWD